MTYDAYEQLDGRPNELFEFVQNGVFYRVNPSSVDQLVGAVTYEALAGLSRTEPVQSAELSSGEVRVRVPSTFEIAAEFRGAVPSTLPSLTIFRRHLNDPDNEVFTYWKGTVVSCAFSDVYAELLCMTNTRLFTRPVPRVVYSGLCNHQLYDSQCAIIRGGYEFTGQVTTVDPDGVTMTISGLRSQAASIDSTLSLGLDAAALDIFWQRGVFKTTDSPGEARMVVEANVGGDPDSVRVNFPFRQIEAGDDISVVAGCDHSIETCVQKFNNVINFGGYPYVPGNINNPFQIELASGTNTSGGNSGGGSQTTPQGPILGPAK